MLEKVFTNYKRSGNVKKGPCTHPMKRGVTRANIISGIYKIGHGDLTECYVVKKKSKIVILIECYSLC